MQRRTSGAQKFHTIQAQRGPQLAQYERMRKPILRDERRRRLLSRLRGAHVFSPGPQRPRDEKSTHAAFGPSTYENPREHTFKNAWDARHENGACRTQIGEQLVGGMTDVDAHAAEQIAIDDVMLVD